MFPTPPKGLIGLGVGVIEGEIEGETLADGEIEGVTDSEGLTEDETVTEAVTDSDGETDSEGDTLGLTEGVTDMEGEIEVDGVTDFVEVLVEVEVAVCVIVLVAVCVLVGVCVSELVRVWVCSHFKDGNRELWSKCVGNGACSLELLLTIVFVGVPVRVCVEVRVFDGVEVWVLVEVGVGRKLAWQQAEVIANQVPSQRVSPYLLV
jgi:hypothetical protein